MKVYKVPCSVWEEVKIPSQIIRNNKYVSKVVQYKIIVFLRTSNKQEITLKILPSIIKSGNPNI